MIEVTWRCICMYILGSVHIAAMYAIKRYMIEVTWRYICMYIMGSIHIAVMFCSKTFSKSLNLEVHLFVHTEEHSYRCDVRNKTFIDTSTLKEVPAFKIRLCLIYSRTSIYCFSRGWRKQTMNAGKRLIRETTFFNKKSHTLSFWNEKEGSGNISEFSQLRSN